MRPYSLSIILPARNEAVGLSALLPQIRERHPGSEIIVINDGSTDETINTCRACEVKVVSHPYRMGNGAAIKTGARIATGELLVFMDADGQHDPKDITRLMSKLDEGYDMVVGARNSASQASIGRFFANRV